VRPHVRHIEAGDAVRGQGHHGAETRRRTNAIRALALARRSRQGRHLPSRQDQLADGAAARVGHVDIALSIIGHGPGREHACRGSRAVRAAGLDLGARQRRHLAGGQIDPQHAVGGFLGCQNLARALHRHRRVQASPKGVGVSRRAVIQHQRGDAAGGDVDAAQPAVAVVRDDQAARTLVDQSRELIEGRRGANAVGRAPIL
jgi:hypothetical protein